MKVLTKVTEEERDEIKSLFQRKNSLKELLKSLDPDNDALYEKALRDFGETDEKFHAWWDRMAEKYNLEGKGSDKSWNIKFETCEIRLED